MKREWKLFIRDIYDSIQYIKEFVGEMNRKEFLADEKTRSAIAFKIENIGEASKNIPKEIRVRYKDLPWTDMARMITESAFTVKETASELQAGKRGRLRGRDQGRAS